MIKSMDKKVPLWIVLLLLWFSFILIVIFGWAVWHIEKNSQDEQQYNSKISRLALFIASSPHLIKESFTELKHSRRLIRNNIFPQVSGFKIEKKYVDSNYILLSAYDKKEDQSTVKLMRLSDQKIIYQWKPNFDEIKKQTINKSPFWNVNNYDVRLVHPLLTPDGSIIFNALYSLIKIDKDSKLIWVINGMFHHSNEYDANGNIWTPSEIQNSKYLPQPLIFCVDNAITKVSPNGKVLLKKSVVQILIENGYRGLLLGVGNNEKDLLHLNDIQPALTSSRFWMKDDLLISSRHKSTVFLYRPSTNKIIWLKTGPWLNQHDVDFIDSTRIGIFGNNVIRYYKGDKLLTGHNEEYIYNFKTNSIETPYTEFLKNANVSTITEGRSDILPNGDLFIEETNNNRLLRGNKKNIIWQYVDRIDQHSVGVLTWSRFISKEEFNKLTFLKNN
jgi:hypothetical protein